MNTGEEAIASKHKLLTTIGWQIGDKVTYALEGYFHWRGDCAMAKR